MALKGRPPKAREDWMESVAELMVREHMTFTSASMALGRKYQTAQEEFADRYCEAFQNVLDAIEFKFYSRIGDNPLLTKGVLAGALMTAIRRLGEQDAWGSVHMPGKLLADLMGWTSQTPDAPVLANLSQKDIDELKLKVAEAQRLQEEEAKTPQPVKVVIVDGTPN